MATYIAADWTWVQLAVVVVFALLMRLSAQDTSDLEQLLVDAVLDALNTAHIGIKDAASALGISEPLLRRQLRREPHQHLSLTRMIRLPFLFWMFFGPSLFAIVAKKRLRELAEMFGDLKRSA